MQVVFYNLFMFLAFLVLVIFIMGMIKPQVFRKTLKKNANRKYIAVVTVIFFFVFAGLGSALEPASVRQAREQKDEQARIARQLEDEEKKKQEELAQQQATEAKKEETPPPISAEEQARLDKEQRRNYWHQIMSVIDGDTIKAMVDGKEEVIRIYGIDAPETNECFANESTAKATEFLQGKWIQLEEDDSQDNRDTYGRLLRYVWFDDGTDFGRRMMEEGYVYEYTYKVPYIKQAQYKETQEYSKSKQFGLWSPDTCNGQRQKPTPKPSATSSSTTTQATPTPAPASASTATPSGDCDPNYTPCIPYKAGNALNCSDIKKKVTVIGVDHNKFDADHNGTGCEAYP